MSNSYIGQPPVFGDFPSEIITGDGTSFYELSFKTNGTNGLLVFLNGAVQRPGVDFTCDGDALTFSTGVPAGVQIFVYGMGLPKSSLAPSFGSVGLGELSDEVRVFGSESQDWTNVLKLLTPQGLNDSLKGSNQLLAANGYQKLPGGLIIQWGSVTGSFNLTTAGTFPIAFPNQCLSCSPTWMNAGTTGHAEYAQVHDFTQTSFRAVTYTDIAPGNTLGTLKFGWFAIGY